MIMIWLNWCINYISGQTTGLDHRSACSFLFLTVLSILTVVSNPTVVYPKVVLTVVFIPTVVYILTVVSSLSDYSPQHSPHSLSYFHVIFISGYPAVRVKFYAYANAWQKWFHNKLTYYLLERKADTASLQLHEGQIPTQGREWQFGKGLHELKDHVVTV